MPRFLSMRRVCGLVCVALLAFAGSASAIIGGSYDGNEHPYVGVIKDASGGRFCSGTLIAPTVMLTAAHCFADGTNVVVSFDADVTAFQLTGVFRADPQYCCGLDNPFTHDIAVVLLSSARSGPRGQVAGLGTADTLPKKAPLTAVGYGAQEFTQGGGKPQPVVLRQRFNVDVELANDSNGASVSPEFIKLATSASGNKGGVCFGDSGGPILSPGTNVIVATVSFGSNGKCNGPSYASRVDTQQARAFLSQFVSLS
jgi:secreted trypsin-like serine protease